MKTPKGWQCPLCGMVYAPDVKSCSCSVCQRPIDKPQPYPVDGAWHIVPLKDVPPMGLT